MNQHPVWFTGLAAVLLTAGAQGAEPPSYWLAPPEHARLSITDDAADQPTAATAGISPYQDWPDRGMAAPPDMQARRDEIHPQQAELLNAAFAGYGYRDDAHCRAGWPECVRPRAIPSDTGNYCGYYVGGGAVWHGNGRYRDEGTWGWDYLGLVCRKRVALDWWHGRYQGGFGQYETDGPKIRHHE